MSKINSYISVVGVENLIVGGAGACLLFLLFLLVPKRWSLNAALMVFPSWLMLGLLSDLGVLSSAAKATGPMFSVVLLVFVWRGRNAIWDASMTYWSYYLFGMIGVAAVMLGPPPVLLPLVIKTQWLVLAIAAVALACNRDPEDKALQRLLLPLMIGFAVALVILAIPAMSGRGLRAGIERYFPWGANPNQAGPYMATAAFLGLLELRRANGVWKYVGGLTAVAAFGVILLTKSRGALFLALIASVPLVPGLLRNPVALAITAIIGGGTVFYVADRYFADQSLDRFFDQATSQRKEVGLAYLQEIKKKPLTGQMLSTRSIEAEGVKSTHTHNIYLETLVEGGIVYFFPLVLIVALAFTGGLLTAISPEQYAVDPLVARSIFSWVTATALHGFVNNNSYYGTSAFAFLVVFFGAISMQAFCGKNPHLRSAFGRR